MKSHVVQVRRLKRQTRMEVKPTMHPFTKAALLICVVISAIGLAWVLKPNSKQVSSHYNYVASDSFEVYDRASVDASSVCTILLNQKVKIIEKTEVVYGGMNSFFYFHVENKQACNGWVHNPPIKKIE